MKKHTFFNLSIILVLPQMATAMQVEMCEANPCGLPNVSERVCGSWDLFADAFVWYTSEQASSVWTDILKIGNNTSSFTAQNLKFGWDFGFRAGAGYNFEYDQWDTQLYWTWFQARAHQRIEEFPQFVPVIGGVLVTEEIHPEFFAADLSKDFSQNAKIHWGLHYNMADWELGRRYWVSRGLSIRPFIGLKGGWINQSIHVEYGNLIINSALTQLSARERLKNNFWGIGPVGGANTKWKLGNCCAQYPSFFGDFSASTLWGTWHCSDVYLVTNGEKIAVSSRNSTLGALMFRGFLGLGWDVDFYNSHFAAKLGYEMQFWVNQLRVATSQLVRLHGDLTLQGVTFNCRLDF